MDVNPEAMAFIYVLVSGWWTWIGHQARHKILSQRELWNWLFWAKRFWAPLWNPGQSARWMIGWGWKWLETSVDSCCLAKSWWGRYPNGGFRSHGCTPIVIIFFIGFSWILHLSSILAEYSTRNNPSWWDFPYIIFPFQTIHFGVPHDYGPRPLQWWIVCQDCLDAEVSGTGRQGSQIVKSWNEYDLLCCY